MGFLSDNYLAIKALHVITVVTSISLFIFRFSVSLSHPGRLAHRWVRILPHLNDSAHLVFAVLLCIVIQQAPGVTPWLSEKVFFVVLYILSGMFALKWAKTRLARAIWFIIAVSFFAYTATIAVNKSPLVF